MLQKTLSGLERLPVLKVSIVGTPVGSAMSMLKVPTRSTSTDMASRLAFMKSWVLVGSSKVDGVC